MSSDFELVNIAVSSNILRLSLSFKVGVTALNPNINAIGFIADNQEDSPFVYKFGRDIIASKLSSGSLELLVSDLPVGFKYGFYMYEAWADGSERELAQAQGIDRKFVLASAPGIPKIEFESDPVLSAAATAGKVQVQVKLKVIYPDNDGGVDLSSIAIFANNNGDVKLVHEQALTVNDLLMASKQVQLSPIDVDDGKVLRFYATVGNSSGESDLSNILSVKASIKPNAPTGLVAKSREYDGTNLNIPVEFNVDKTDLSKWSKFSILVKDSAPNSYLLTDIVNQNKPNDVSTNTKIARTVTQVDGSPLRPLRGYELVAVLHNSNINVSALNGSDVSELSNIAKAFVTLAQNKVTLAFDATYGVKENNGALEIQASISGGNSNDAIGTYEVDSQVVTKGTTAALVGAVAYQSGTISQTTTSSSLTVPAGKWSVDDTLVLEVVIKKRLTAAQLEFNVTPSLDTAPYVILATGKLEFKPPQKLPSVAISELFSAKLNNDFGVYLRWVAPELPAGVKINKYVLNMASAPAESSRFALDALGAKDKDVIGVADGDIEESAAVYKYLLDGDTGITSVSGLSSGEIVYVRIQPVFTENGATRSGSWSDWVEYEQPVDRLDGIPTPTPTEKKLGVLALEFTDPSPASGWSLNGFMLKYYNEDGSLFVSEEKPAPALAVNEKRKFELEVPESKRDQNITPMVIAKYKNNSTGKIVDGLPVLSASVFIHKAIVINSLEVVISNLKAKVTAVIDNGRAATNPQVLAIFPYSSSGSTKLDVVLGRVPNTNDYVLDNLDVLPGLDYSKVVTALIATNNVSTSSRFHPNDAAVAVAQRRMAL